MKKKVFSMIALLLMAVTGAVAQTEELLTTITATGTGSYSETTTGVVTVTHDNNDYGEYGWLWNKEGAITVEAKEGYTITRCVFRHSYYNSSVTISSAPFKVKFVGINMGFGMKYLCEGANPLDEMDGVSSIEVYGYAAPPTYSVTLPEGTEDAENWTISDGTNSAKGNVGLKGLNGTETVTITYTGTKKVIGVKVEKKSEAVENAYQKWNADQKKLVATEIPTTAIKVASTDVNWQGTYVVDGEVTINGEITLNGDVNLIIKDGAKLTANKINGNSKNLSIYGQAQKTGELVVNGSEGDAITDITILEVHSAKVKATASSSDPSFCCGGFFNIEKFNVYGGLVDAKSTAGYGICLKGGGSMKIYGGEVKAEGNGAGDWNYGILCADSNNPTVTVYGGKLWSGSAVKKAFNNVNLQKGEGFTGKIEYSSDNSTWSETVDADAKYVRVGY